jgi:hypothetical protein
MVAHRGDHPVAARSLVGLVKPDHGETWGDLAKWAGEIGLGA